MFASRQRASDVFVRINNRVSIEYVLYVCKRFHVGESVSRMGLFLT